MRIRLLAFASAADALGASEIELELPESSSLADLQSHLERDHPAVAPLWSRLAVAVDGVLAGERHPLKEGCEVALLPPVSGGRDSGTRARIVDHPIDLDTLIEDVRAPGYGALVTFVGTVRDTFDGHRVSGIQYNGYTRMAEARLARIEQELEAEGVELRLRIVHRLGDLQVGEVSVAIAAASPHRDAAFSACRSALERLKKEVPIWKLERYSDGERAWREEEPLQPER